MKKKLELEDLIEIFLTYSIHQIKNETETPNINFIFENDAYVLFKIAMNNRKNEIHRIYQEDINFLIKHSNDDCISIHINDALKFFEYLTDITNETIKLFYEYGDCVNARETAVYLLRRIWLRMGINDVENIYTFLDNQLQFVRNRTFDNLDYRKDGLFQQYDVFMKTKVNDLWDETTRSMYFTLKKDEYEYELPHILYEVDNNGICYIYGVQRGYGERSKSIERKLYSLNKGIDNPNVHPSKICALLLFMSELKRKNISKVFVPSMQVLSYHYHELLSLESKKNYEEIANEYEKHRNDDYLKSRYNYLKNWYNHVYEKQDKISYLKTEELINLMYRLIQHDSNVEIINDINIQGDSLILKI